LVKQNSTALPYTSISVVAGNVLRKSGQHDHFFGVLDIHAKTCMIEDMSSTVLSPAPRGSGAKEGMKEMEAIDLAERMISDGVAPDAEYKAVAGADYGWAKAWKVESGYVVQYGDSDNTYAGFDKNSHLEDDDLASWLEWQDLDRLEAIEQRANIRGADAIPDAGEDQDGPFYVLVTRYWYGPREASGFVTDDRGEPLEFESIKDARDWIKRNDSEVYYLAHGEYARPAYKVVTV